MWLWLFGLVCCACFCALCFCWSWPRLLSLLGVEQARLCQVTRINIMRLETMMQFTVRPARFPHKIKTVGYSCPLVSTKMYKNVLFVSLCLTHAHAHNYSAQHAESSFLPEKSYSHRFWACADVIAVDTDTCAGSNHVAVSFTRPWCHSACLTSCEKCVCLSSVWDLNRLSLFSPLCAVIK